MLALRADRASSYGASLPEATRTVAAGALLAPSSWQPPELNCEPSINPVTQLLNDFRMVSLLTSAALRLCGLLVSKLRSPRSRQEYDDSYFYGRRWLAHSSKGSSQS